MSATDYPGQLAADPPEPAGEMRSAPPDRVNRTLFDLQFHDFFWDVIQHGDCFCRQTNLRIYSDGLADFSAFTSTTDEGDVWIFRGIALLGPNGDELFRIAQFDGPTMDLSAHDYFVVRTRFTNPLIYPQQLFSVISSAVIYHHC